MNKKSLVFVSDRKFYFIFILELIGSKKIIMYEKEPLPTHKTAEMKFNLTVNELE
jgi:hypothetical protein